MNVDNRIKALSEEKFSQPTHQIAYQQGYHDGINHKENSINKSIEDYSIEDLMCAILVWSNKYQITFQFWGIGNNNVFIEKDGTDLWDRGGLEMREALIETVKYLDKINNIKDGNEQTSTKRRISTNRKANKERNT